MMRTRLRGRANAAAVVSLSLMSVVACSSTGATFRSGVGDAFPEHPPYYAGSSAAVVAGDTARVGYFPIAYQRGAAQSPIFDPPQAGALAALLADMNAYLDSLASAARVGARLAPAAGASGLVPPDVIFGCLTESGAPDDDCEVDRGSALGRGRRQMRLAVGRPSPAWAAAAQERMTAAGVARALSLTLEVGQMLPRQSGFVGSKSVELGTGHTVELPWLTSLETPVTVLQLTGALVDRDGKAIRIGAEGFLAKRTPFLASAAGAQALLSDADVAEVRARRREDLPGQPLAWQVALRQLVEQLTGRAASNR